MYITREYAKRMVSILNAYIEGKPITFNNQPIKEIWGYNLLDCLEKYEIVKEKYIPFDYLDDLVGAVLKWKEKEVKYLIVKQNEDGVFVYNECKDYFYSYETLFKTPNIEISISGGAFGPCRKLVK